MRKISFLLLIFVSSIAQARWPENGAIDIAAMRAHPENFIEQTNTQCNSPDIQTFVMALSQYQAFMKAGDGKNNKKADQQRQLIETAINEAHGTPCYDFISRIYLAKSLEILLNDDLIEFTNPGNQQIQQGLRSRVRLQAGQVEMATANDVLYFLSLYFMNRVPITFLNSSVRADLAQATGNTMWTQNSTAHPDRPAVLGAYRCSDQTIFLDSHLPPYDLAAIWIHEMDHLYRDIQGPVAIWQNTPLEAIRSDELLASVLASLSQWNVRRASLPIEMDFKERLVHAFVRPPQDLVTQDQFFIQGDLNFLNKAGALGKLYSPNGVLKSMAVRNNNYETLWAYFFPDNWTKIYGPDGFNGPNSGISPNWVYGQPFNTTTEKTYKATDLVNQIDSIVANAYFGSTPLQSFRSQTHDIGLIGLSQQAQNISFPRYLDQMKDNFMLNMLMTNLDGLLGHESPACQAFEAAGNAGKLDGYLQGKSGTDSDKPGKDGARPGKDGARPGKDGTRPSLTIRPCLDIDDL